jgi:hypothetical protein
MKFNSETAEHIERLNSQGKTLVEIAKETGISIYAIKKYKREFNMPRSTATYKYLDKYSDIENRLKRGDSVCKIAKDLDMNRQTIYKYCQHHDIVYGRMKNPQVGIIKGMLDNGSEVSEIASALGYTDRNIRYYINKYKLREN